MRIGHIFDLALEFETPAMAVLATAFDPIKAELLEGGAHVAALKIRHLAVLECGSYHHISCFPPELAACVFEFYVKMHEYETEDTFPDKNFRTVAPFRLGSICHEWRAIAWSTPQLWTNMVVDIYYKGGSGLPELAGKQWMERTGGLPLSIHLYTSHVHDDTCSPSAERENALSLISLLAPSLYRCETLNLEIPLELISAFRSINTGAHSSLLRRLKLATKRSEIHYHEPLRLFSGTDVVHSPTHVALEGVGISEIAIEWKNLADLNIGNYAVDDCISVIRQAPSLAACTIWDIGSVDETTASLQSLIDQVVAPKLRSLKLVEFGTGNSHAQKALIDQLILPCLESLSYYGGPEPEYMPVDCLKSLIERSSCNLTSLNIGLPYVDEADLIPLLDAVPNTLTSFSAHLHPEQYLEILFTPLSQQPHFLPNLQKMTLKIHHNFLWETIPDIFDPGQRNFRQTSESARSHPLQRQSLELSVDLIGDVFEPDDYIDKTTLRRLSKLRSQGIVFSIVRCDSAQDSDSFELLDTIPDERYYDFYEKSMLFRLPALHQTIKW